MGWTAKNAYLTEAEKQGNVSEARKKFMSFEIKPMAAMFGNMDYESNINPAIYQNLKPNLKAGYGLVQWTPASDIQNWLRSQGFPITDGNAQCERINYEMHNGLQWIATTKYPYSFKQFSKLKDKSIEDLTEMFMRNYERPRLSTANLTERIKRAKKWLAFLDGEFPPDPTDPEDPVFPPEDDLNQKRRKYIILLGRRRTNGG